MSSDSTRHEVAIFMLGESSFETTASDCVITHKNFDQNLLPATQDVRVL
jgi:hypothetical protein